MCYTRKNQSFEEEARRMRAEEGSCRREEEARQDRGNREKPVVEKAKEIVGAGR